VETVSLAFSLQPLAFSLDSVARSNIRRQLILWSLALGLWCLLVLAFAGQVVFARSIDWVDAVKISLHDWVPWALLAPLVAALAYWFPLRHPKLYYTIPIHILACAGSLFIAEWINRSLEPFLRPSQAALRFNRPGAPDEPFERGRAFGPPPRRPEPDEFPPGPGFEPPPDRGFAPPLEARRAGFLRNSVMRGRFNAPVYWIVVSIVHALSYYRRSQERERKAIELENRLTQARLEVLRMQLHPHFLFNTLHAISTLVHKDPKAADEMITNLSELLRATLDSSDQQEIPLRQELDLLDRYLEIQQVRFGQRLQIEKQIDTSALDAVVPTLILQPLVENAIKHGIEPRPGPGRILIRAQKNDRALHLSIRDNGNGLQPAPNKPEGIGLANTRARLQELYGSQARLLLNSGSDGGCSVELEMPYRAVEQK
jgi:two-component sensor histidine kinase